MFSVHQRKLSQRKQFYAYSMWISSLVSNPAWDIRSHSELFQQTVWLSLQGSLSKPIQTKLLTSDVQAFPTLPYGSLANYKVGAYLSYVSIPFQCFSTLSDPPLPSFLNWIITTAGECDRCWYKFTKLFLLSLRYQPIFPSSFESGEEGRHVILF